MSTDLNLDPGPSVGNALSLLVPGESSCDGNPASIKSPQKAAPSFFIMLHYIDAVSVIGGLAKLTKTQTLGGPAKKKSENKPQSLH